MNQLISQTFRESKSASSVVSEYLKVNCFKHGSIDLRTQFPVLLYTKLKPVNICTISRGILLTPYIEMASAFVTLFGRVTLDS
jgi:hypothetical protein